MGLYQLLVLLFTTGTRRGYVYCHAKNKLYICIFVVFTTSRFYIMYSASERASRCQLGWQAAILPLDHERAWGMRMRSPGIEPGSAANCI